MRPEFIVFAGALALTSCGAETSARDKAPPVAAPAGATTTSPTRIEWDDADSGRLNGVRFRIADVDAPETGGVGAAIGAALCEEERAKGLASKAWAEGFTSGATIVVTDEYGFDRMPEPRQLVDLSVNGQDYAAAGVSAGHLRAWPHDGAKALARKPDWCAAQRR